MNRKEIAILTILFLAILGAVALTPAEGNIGWKIRLVYAHGAGVWAALGLFVLASVIAVLSIFKRGLGSLFLATEYVATGLWIISFLMAILATKIVWGAVFFAEPRMLTSLKVLSVSIAVDALLSLSKQPLVAATLLFTRTVAAFYWIAATELVMHPDRPVLQSALDMKLHFVTVLVSIFLFALAVALIIKRRMEAIRD